MSHDELKALLPLRALDQLDPDEARALADHLANGCPECDREIDEFREALGEFAIAAANADGADERIWKLIEPRLAHAQLTDRPGGRYGDRPLRRPRGTRMVAGAMAVVAAALGFAVIGVERNIESARHATDTEIAGLRARIDYLQMGLETASAKLSDLKTQLLLASNLSLAALSPDARVVRLNGLAAAPGAHATLALSAGNKTAFMQVSGLPVAPQDKIYEAWWIGRDTGPIRAGLFDAPAEGIAKVQLIMPPRGEEIIASAITLEPAGGSDKPTGAMYLKGDFPRL
jgi:hypothetical protein